MNATVLYLIRASFLITSAIGTLPLTVINATVGWQRGFRNLKSIAGMGKRDIELVKGW